MNVDPAAAGTANQQAPQPERGSARLAARLVCAAVCAVILVAVLYHLFALSSNYRRMEGNIQFDALAYTDQVKAAIAQKLESSKGLMQASLLVFAVLWGLILAKKGEGKLNFGEWLEKFMFLTANVCFAASWWFYSEYTDFMAALHTASGAAYADPKDQVVMNFLDPQIDDFLRWQSNMWAGGVIATGLVLISTHLLKESPPCPEPDSSSSAS